MGTTVSWCQVLRGKYGRGYDNFYNVIIKPFDSNFWKNIGKGQSIKSLISWDIRNGEMTNAWINSWIPSGVIGNNE